MFGMNKTNKFTVPVSSMDFAALLATLGFEMKHFEIIHHIKMENRDKRTKTAVFEFADTSESGCSMKGVKENYSFPDKGKEATHFSQYAKIAAHNYQILKSVIKDNRPLQQIIGENYCILKNMNGTEIEGEETPYKTSELSVIAIASALGYNISSYKIVDDNLVVYYNESIEEIMNEWMTDRDDDTYDYLNILINTFKNRKFLMEETYAKHTLHLMNGEKQVIVGKNMDEKLKKKVTDFIN